jgi:hypothetical protein
LTIKKEVDVKNIILLMVTLFLLSNISNIAYAELSKQELAQELAQEVAHCYVANQRGNTALFKSGEAEKMRVVIADLIGSDNINKTIQIAARVQSQNGQAGNGFVHKDIKKFCRPLDEMLIDK